MTTDVTLNETLGKRLKDIRKERRITRELLAEKIEVSSRFLAGVESGQVGVSLSTLKRICKYLGVSSDYLLGITCESNDIYGEIKNRIDSVSSDALPYLKDIVIAFSAAVDNINKEKTEQ